MGHCGGGGGGGLGLWEFGGIPECGLFSLEVENGDASFGSGFLGWVLGDVIARAAVERVCLDVDPGTDMLMRGTVRQTCGPDLGSRCETGTAAAPCISSLAGGVALYKGCIASGIVRHVV